MSCWHDTARRFGKRGVIGGGVGWVVGEVFNFGRHMLTHGWMALGLTEADGSGWYRLFRRGRYAELRVARLFFRETVSHTALDGPYVVGIALGAY